MAQLTESEAFLLQARSDFLVFQILAAMDRDTVPECHPLHFFHMATEKLAKAAVLAIDQTSELKKSHGYFEKLWYGMNRRDVGRSLGYQNFKHYSAILKRLSPLVRQIVELHPTVRDQGIAGRKGGNENVEYPWKSRVAQVEENWIAPCQHDFRVLKQAHSGDWAILVRLVQTCLMRFDAAFTHST